MIPNYHSSGIRVLNFLLEVCSFMHLERERERRINEKRFRELNLDEGLGCL